MTCTHVVAAAVGTRAVRPGHQVKLRMPGLIEYGGRRPLQFEVVEAHRWFDGSDGGTERERELEDICLLRIVEGEILPRSACTVKSDIQKVEERLGFRGKGLREYRGTSGPKLYDAEIRGVVGLPSLQRWTVKAYDSDEAPRKGSSGAGVYHEDKGLLGMVSMTQGERSGQIIPIDILRKVFPIGPVASSQSAVLESCSRAPRNQLQRTWARAIYKLDRKPQIDDFKQLYRARWDSRKQGFMCVVGGLPEDLPFDCVERFCTEYWQWTFKALHEKQRPSPIDLDWPRRIGMRGRRHYLLRLQNALVKELKAEGADPAQIRSAIDRLNKPVIFYSLIDQSRFNSEQAKLLREWTEYFATVNSEPLSQMLIHVVLLCFDPSGPYAASIDDGAELLEGLCDAAYDRDEFLIHPIEVLDALRTDEVKTWIVSTGNELARSEQDIREMTDAAANYFGETGEFRYLKAKEWIRTYREA